MSLNFILEILYFIIFTIGIATMSVLIMKRMNRALDKTVSREPTRPKTLVKLVTLLTVQLFLILIMIFRIVSEYSD